MNFFGKSYPKCEQYEHGQELRWLRESLGVSNVLLHRQNMEKLAADISDAASLLMEQKRQIDDLKATIAFMKRGVTAMGYQDKGGDLYQNWAYFAQPVSDEDIEKFLVAACWHEFYIAPGYAFARRPVIRRQGKRTLVTWTHGLDI